MGSSAEAESAATAGLENFLAAVDLGSNSFHMVVAEEVLSSVHSACIVNENLDDTGRQSGIKAACPQKPGPSTPGPPPATRTALGKTIRNGTINSPRVSPAQSKMLNHPAIVTVAGMYERKGIRDLIGAFASLPSHVQAHLYLVGEGPDRAAFEGAAAQSGRAAFIHFEGFQRQPQAYMQDADIFVLASHKEPWGLVLSEARELGCAIVATRVGGIPEVLEHGHAGLLFPVGDVSALTALLLQLIESPEECGRLRNRAQENLQCLTVERMTGEVLKLYRDMLES